MRAGTLSGLALAALSCSSHDPEHVDFARDIEPVFRERCYGCHGTGEAEAGLRLDDREAALGEGANGRRVVPRNPEGSELYRRVAGLGTRERMPMGGRLAPQEIALIRRWIEEGAPWPEDGTARPRLPPDWAYTSPERQRPPAVGDEAWIENPIDRFVLARIESAGMEPSPRASKETLIRRASLDLTGIPPTTGELDAFLADNDPGYYERLVDRLLASPHYGERWGRTWLDAARYADSNGYEKDRPRAVWAYRDWVVEALNQDMPYDRFVIEQVAGDLLPGAGQPQRVATGFLRNSMANEEGGADPEQFRMEALFDRMDAIGKAVLGLTIQCAQCHDHKYDPISQGDYYRMLAMLNDSYDATQAVYDRDEERQRQRVLEGIRAVERELRRSMPDWRERQGGWEAAVAGDQPAWVPLDARIELGSGEKYQSLPDKSILAQGFAPTQSVVSPTAAIEAGVIRAVRLELITDPRLPLGGPGRSFRGTAALSEFTIDFASQASPDVWEPVRIRQASADVNPPVRPLDAALFPQADGKSRAVGDISLAIDGDDLTAWHTDSGPGRRNVHRKAVFQLAEPIAVREPSLIRFNLAMKHGGSDTDADHSQNLGRFRFSVTDAPGAVADPLPAEVRRIVSSVPGSQRSPQQEAAVFRHWLSTVPSWDAARHRIERLWEQHPEGTSQLVSVKREQPRTTYLLMRGDFLRPAGAVEPGVPSSMHPGPAGDSKPGRLELARWLVDRNAPTTARAVANRIWHGHFGAGLVASVEDLGLRSAEPSHPELLDWLAVELMDNAWSLKHIHRLVVLSATYRQSSRIPASLLERDPRNRLLARAGRFRVDAETVRDIALAAGGLLSKDLGGPPVHPPAPAFLFRPPASYGPKRWPVAEGRQRYRRGLYVFRYRSVPYPVFETFDAPSGKFSCVRRERSNTPLQALITLNETTFVEAARSLALAVLSVRGANDSERAEFLFRRVLSRSPGRAERTELLSLLRRARARFARSDKDARALVRGSTHAGDAIAAGPKREWAAWTAVARVVLNLDEAITRE